MILSKEHRDSLTNHYDELAEELEIFYTALKCNGFNEDQAIEILLAIVTHPTESRLSKRQAIQRNQERIARLKDLIKREDVAKVPTKPDFTDHDGSHDYD